MRVFWDTNILLDLVDRDRPDHPYANALLRWSGSKPVANLCAWHSLSILDYLVCKKFGRKDTNEILREILQVFAIPSTGTQEAKDALIYNNEDFEDAMQISSAILGRADFIITRDVSGFHKSPIPVIPIDQFLTRYTQSENS